MSTDSCGRGGGGAASRVFEEGSASVEGGNGYWTGATAGGGWVGSEEREDGEEGDCVVRGMTSVVIVRLLTPSGPPGPSTALGSIDEDIDADEAAATAAAVPSATNVAFATVVASLAAAAMAV